MDMASARARPDAAAEPDFAALLLGAMPVAVLTVDSTRRIASANPAAEQLLGAGRSFLTRHRLEELVAADSPLVALVDLAARGGAGVSEYGIALSSQRLAERLVDVHVTPLGDDSATLLVCLVERSMARLIDRHLNHRSAARSVTGMAAVLAHELKNPLSGIRGAAQLIEQSVDGPERELAQMIREETDRIRHLVERVDVFHDDRPPTGERVNIHRVLEHVRRLAGKHGGLRRPVHRTIRPVAAAGVGQPRPVGPGVPEHRPERGRGGRRKRGAGWCCPRATGSASSSPAAAAGALDLPIVVAIEDNGSGVAEDLRDNLFEPFVTTRRHGTGLGLALVANIVENHGGVVEFETKRGRTVFRVRLPAMADGGGEG